MRKAQGIGNIRGFALAVCALLAGCAAVPEPVAVQAPAPVEVRSPKTAHAPAPPRAPVVRPAAPSAAAAAEQPEAISLPAPVASMLASRYPGRQQGVARVLELLPRSVTRDRNGWAADIFAAFVALRLAPTAENFCAAIAVIEQESGFVADPVVPGLSRIAWREIEARRQRFHIPKLALDAALAKPSPNGQTYKRRLDTLRTEREMSVLYDDMIAELPGGRLLLSGYNPVHTGGPMQVSIAFAETHARAAPEYGGGVGKGLRNAVFTRPGGLYFGIAHLLDYPAPYHDPLFRFADFNAGHYSSRNAAFQQAVARLTGVKLVLDGDLLRYQNGAPSGEASATQKAMMALSGRLKLDPAEILAGLRQEKRESFARTQLYLRVFAMADEAAGARVPREAMPRIELKSPKIQRKLTTAWFAERVHMRYRACMKRAPVA
ncbi:DUF1615 domain-containing protein [Azoarcus sp. PA01]|nr:DUF1615 domain-containing protein [Azoarcus sp. PA01]